MTTPDPRDQHTQAYSQAQPPPQPASEFPKYSGYTPPAEQGVDNPTSGVQQKPENNTTLYVLGGVAALAILVAIGAFVLMANKQAPPATDTVPASPTVITMTEAPVTVTETETSTREAEPTTVTKTETETTTKTATKTATETETVVSTPQAP